LSFAGTALQDMPPRLQLKCARSGEAECSICAIDLLLPHQRAAAQTFDVHLLKVVVTVLKPGAAKMRRSRIFDEIGH
jgi:hypothetical protein